MTPAGIIEGRTAMGTRFEIALPGADTDHLQAAAEAALDEVERLEAQLSRYRVESEVSGLNARAAERPIRVEPRLFALLRRALEVSRDTDGAFDPTLGPLLMAWGFIGGAGRMPDPGAVETARAVTGAALVELDEEGMTVRFTRPGVSLDLGAIGKGYALGRALEALEDAGVGCALLHAGTSTVYGLGSPPGAEGGGWRVALHDPIRGAGHTVGEVMLHDRALSVSAPHGKAFRQGDRLYGHVLDPRTGEPTRGSLLAAVSHRSAALTDALSTALLVLGPDGLPTLNQRYPDADFLVQVDEGGRLLTYAAGPGVWELRLDPAYLG